MSANRSTHKHPQMDSTRRPVHDRCNNLLCVAYVSSSNQRMCSAPYHWHKSVGQPEIPLLLLCSRSSKFPLKRRTPYMLPIRLLTLVVTIMTLSVLSQPINTASLAGHKKSSAKQTPIRSPIRYGHVTQKTMDMWRAELQRQPVYVPVISSTYPQIQITILGFQVQNRKVF